MLIPFLCLLLALPVPAEQEVPPHDGYVTDLGDMLTDGQEAELEELMGSFERGAKAQVALLTIPSLDGRSLEDLALAVLRGWGIGDAERDDGALLLVVRDDRKMRWEVGYGLEGNLTDARCGRIIRDVIAPEFQAGRYYEGIRDGIVAAHAAIGGDYGPIERRSSSGGRQKSVGAVVGLAQVVFMIMFLLAALGRRRRGGGLFEMMLVGSLLGGGGRSRGWHGGGGLGGGGGFGGFGGGGGGGGGASGGW